jgi:hypothetical protein
MIVRCAARLALASVVFAGATAANAATKTQCENISRPAGYVTIESGIVNGSCPTGRAVKYQTPEPGMWIPKPQELHDWQPPYVVTSVTKVGSIEKYQIQLAKDGLAACAAPPIRPYNFFTKPNGTIAGCPSTSSPSVGNSVKFYQHMWVELARPVGKPGELRVNLNTNWTAPSRNYVVKTTSHLNGGSQTVMKSGLTTTNSFQLKDVAPDFVADAKQGANFTFVVELFQGSTSMSKYSISATGQEMIKN